MSALTPFDRELTDDEVLAIREAKQRGVSNETLAYRFALSVERIKSIRGPRKPTWPNRRLIIDVGDGVKLTVRQIAEIAGVRRTTIHERIKRGIRGKDLLTGHHGSAPLLRPVRGERTDERYRLSRRGGERRGEQAMELALTGRGRDRVIKSDRLTSMATNKVTVEIDGVLVTFENAAALAAWEAGRRKSVRDTG